MNTLKYPTLYTPIQLGKMLFRNRIFASPQDYPGLTGDRFLTEEAAYFYERKAQGGFASVCVGDMMIDGDFGRSHPFQMRGNDIMSKVNMSRVSTGIKRHGAVAAIELTHGGQNANPALMDKEEKIVYGPIDFQRPDGVEVHAMKEEQIEKMIQLYVDAALFARQCGFGMITLHGGHGWQMHQFISPRDNKRTDRWGGSTENRMRFPLAVIEAIRKNIGYQIPIEFRMSAAEYLPDGYDLDEGIAIAKALDDKVDLIHISVGHHEIDAATMRTHPTMFLEDGCNVKFSEEIKKHVNTPVAIVGALTDPEMMEEIIASGKADVVALGRQSLADPDLPVKGRMGKEEEITPCLRCFNCFSNSTIDGVFYCAVNPEIGREQASMYQSPPLHKKTVLIAGGGIGGMEAALTAEKYGHEVILCEKNERLGGALLCEEKIPFKHNLSVYLKRQAKKIENSSIQLKRNTVVTPELIETIQPDVIIAAMGARPIKPKIEGINDEYVAGAEEVYYHPEIVGKRAVIMGGGLVGLELGIFLAQNKHEVTIVEMAPGTVATPPEIEGTSNRMSGLMGLPAGYPLVHGVALTEMLKTLPNMKICCSTKALRVLKEGLLVEGKEGQYMIEADTIIYAIGQNPLHDEAMALAACAPEFYQIGDCVVPDNIYAATSTAYQIALDIGRI